VGLWVELATFQWSYAPHRFGGRRNLGLFGKTAAAACAGRGLCVERFSFVGGRGRR